MRNNKGKAHKRKKEYTELRVDRSLVFNAQSTAKVISGKEFRVERPKDPKAE